MAVWVVWQGAPQGVRCNGVALGLVHARDSKGATVVVRRHRATLLVVPLPTALTPTLALSSSGSLNRTEAGVSMLGRQMVRDMLLAEAMKTDRFMRPTFHLQSVESRP